MINHVRTKRIRTPGYASILKETGKCLMRVFELHPKSQPIFNNSIFFTQLSPVPLSSVSDASNTRHPRQAKPSRIVAHFAPALADFREAYNGFRRTCSTPFTRPRNASRIFILLGLRFSPRHIHPTTSPRTIVHKRQIRGMCNVFVQGAPAKQIQFIRFCFFLPTISPHSPVRCIASFPIRHDIYICLC